MNAIRILATVTLLACAANGQKRPPNYQQNEMPVTSFSCKDKIVGGYYSDPETDCQMFHVCVNVVGFGVQDFRFLCPNNTAFDQENQICDDWYNIDCEAATLYYSDNFDLYRLGSGNPNPTAKVTPIPLGPSSVAPKTQNQPKNRKPLISSPINNAVSEHDDDYYLQRSDLTDSKLQHDLLRGSSSGNFYSNKNHGLEDDYDDAKVISSKNDVKKTQKTRKQLTGRKPVQTSTISSTTSAPSSTTTLKEPTYRPTTYRSKDRGRVNYKTYLDKQAKDEEYDYKKIKPVFSSTFAPVSSTYQPTQFNINAYTQAPQINNNLNQAKNIENQQILSNVNDFQSAKVNTQAPKNNFQQNTYFNNVQMSTPSQFQYYQQRNNANQDFQNTNNQNQRFNYNTNQGFSTTNQPFSTTNNINQGISQNDFNQGFQPNNNINQNFQFNKVALAQTSTQYPTTNAYQTNTFQSNQSPSSTLRYNQPSAPSVYQQPPVVNFFQPSTQFNTNTYQPSSASTQLPSTTEHFSKDFKAKFNPYNSYQRSNEEPGETLKTAHSTNLRPSELNALIQPKTKIINATLSVGYNFNKLDGGVAKSTVFVTTPTTQKPRPFSVTTPISSTTTTTTTKISVPLSKDNKDSKDSSYDYAYYDESNHNEYEDAVGEDFARTKTLKKKV
ncbi:GATA zinc finger domain-containing protein 14 [Daktulosphaira vitifoliae]|uniref:GATA zinc finger domain-containing protein 14 n=1 Tax=Daktulosphaira vitifoliae TaxID=58002 RepID=UPI0021A97E1E|nr:GATA zinc finger domain-containing protein 14 [Daktulosphaira vitifoliae]XP_050535508.1 GATA zinc finger domain-containing protein 14 [Daktulosphaira vitifoliae]